MPDMDRAELGRLVYRRLTDSGFRTRLKATAPDGTRPIIVTLRTDPVSTLLGHLAAVGGAGNVVVPTLNGVVILAMQATHDIDPPGRDVAEPLLCDDCTVGVLLERLKLDVTAGQPVLYHFVVAGPGSRVDRAHAEVVAVAG